MEATSKWNYTLLNSLKLRGYKEEEIVVTSVNENTEETQTKPKGT
jgi:hypothetical protein